MQSVHTKEFLERKYRVEDPWGYQTHPEDERRRAEIVAAAVQYGSPVEGCTRGHLYERALDLGAGEGWITEALPACEVYGYEISDLAAGRFPAGVTRTKEPTGKYDLILLSGVLYGHYDHTTLRRLVYRHSRGIVITCHLEPHEIRLEGRELRRARKFTYRGKKEVLRVYRFGMPLDRPG